MMQGVSLADDLAEDPPACPLLGLELDRWTHFTFGHAGHRCHAAGSPGPVERAHQSTYCLRSAFARCDRYRAWLHRQPSTGVGARDGGGLHAPRADRRS